jgi:hypothetical protein
MPLSAPAARRLQHTRQIECKGYEREDGLWDIEAHLLDTKTYVQPRRGGGERLPGDPVHNMWLRITIDLDMQIHDAEAMTDAGPYSHCGDITVNFKSLIGVKIGRGWRHEINARLGGIKGCTHLVELLGPLGTTAFQATGRARQARDRGKAIIVKPYQIGSCHVYKDGSSAALERWPEFYASKGK